MSVNRFIAYEWIDGAGKDTQLDKSAVLIKTRDKYAQIFYARDPSLNTKAGKLAYDTFLGWWFRNHQHAAEMFVEWRREQNTVLRSILPHAHILSSRFDLSTYAYQWGLWVPFEYIQNLHDYPNLLLPDMTFLFTIDEEKIEERLSKRGEPRQPYEKVDLLSKMQKSYIQAANLLSNNTRRKITFINGNGTVEEVFEQVQSALKIIL